MIPLTLDEQTVLYALEFSAIAHKTQLRKNLEREVPYISHPAAVGYILQQYGFTLPVVVAGILHDTVEDTSVTAEDLEKEFGPQVAGLVLAVTEDKRLSYEQRKLQYFEQVRRQASEAKAICAADQIANIQSMFIMHKRGENLRSSLLRYGTQTAVWVAENRLVAARDNFNHPIIEKLESLTREYLDMLKLYA